MFSFRVKEETLAVKKADKWAVRLKNIHAVFPLNSLILILFQCLSSTDDYMTPAYAIESTRVVVIYEIKF